MRDRDPTRETWDGKRAGPDGAVRDYGADDAFPIGDIDDILPGLIEQCERVYYTMGVNHDFDQRIIGWVNTLRGAGASWACTRRRNSSRSTTCCTTCASTRAARELGVMRRSAQIAVARARARDEAAAARRRTEYEVMAELLHEFRRHDADISYHPIVGGGAERLHPALPREQRRRCATATCC